MPPGNDIETQIKDAVRMALIEEKMADHEARLGQLERFRWWLLTAVAVAASTSTGTLLMLVIKEMHP